ELEPAGPDTVDVEGYDWVVVTSRPGADELARRRRGELPRVAAIGPGTAAALRENGIEPSLVPAVSTQEGLVAELPQPPGRVLFAGAENARPYLVEALGADKVVLYRTRQLEPPEQPEGDLVVLASASAARACAALGLRIPAVSIGPETTSEARAHGIEILDEAETHDLAVLCAAVDRAAARIYHPRAVFITFLSAFGLQDDFVGTCHGVMKRIAPEAEIIDITHGITTQHVLQGALVLANTLPYMPEGVHLAVVDPGVGGQRRPRALATGEGRLLVGPDTGLLIPAAERTGGIAAAHEIANPDYALDSVSRTFHGRDLFSPAAAHLARGAPIDARAPPIDSQALMRLDVPDAEIGQNRIRACVLY